MEIIKSIQTGRTVILIRKLQDNCGIGIDISDKKDKVMGVFNGWTLPVFKKVFPK